MTNNVFFNKIIDQFITKLEYRADAEGFLLTGSYALGTATEHSDIDLLIVLNNEIHWEERGNVIIDDVILEYIAKPSHVWIETIENDFDQGMRLWSSMFALGKILQDENHTVEQIQKLAITKFDVSPAIINPHKTEMTKYHLWARLKELKALSENNSPSFAQLYYLQLATLLDTYAKQTGTHLPPVGKQYQFLTDEKFREAYQMVGFDDTTFTQQAVVCIEDPTYSHIEKLTKYIHEKLGGFSVDGWKLRKEIAT